jgi:hypothetical protein
MQAVATDAKVLEYRPQPGAAGTPPGTPEGKKIMALLLVYVGLMIAGDVVAYFLGLMIERAYPLASLPAFLAMYFLSLGLTWMLAVRLTAPRVEGQKAAT